jgi:hypothetical protein
MKATSPVRGSIIDENKKKSMTATRKVGMHMCSPTLIRQTAARTMSLIQVASSDICSREQDEAEFHHLHMDWILVADKKGNPRPRMHWLIDQ